MDRASVRGLERRSAIFWPHDQIEAALWARERCFLIILEAAAVNAADDCPVAFRASALEEVRATAGQLILDVRLKRRHAQVYS